MATRKISVVIKDVAGVAISNTASTAALPAAVDAASVARNVTIVDGDINLLNAAGKIISTASINVGLCPGV